MGFVSEYHGDKLVSVLVAILLAYGAAMHPIDSSGAGGRHMGIFVLSVDVFFLVYALWILWNKMTLDRCRGYLLRHAILGLAALLDVIVMGVVVGVPGSAGSPVAAAFKSLSSSLFACYLLLSVIEGRRPAQNVGYTTEIWEKDIQGARRVSFQTPDRPKCPTGPLLINWQGDTLHPARQIDVASSDETGNGTVKKIRYLPRTAKMMFIDDDVSYWPREIGIIQVQDIEPMVQSEYSKLSKGTVLSTNEDPSDGR